MCINIAEKEIGSYLDRWSHVSVDRSRNRTTRRIEHTKKVILVRARLIVHTNYRPRCFSFESSPFYPTRKPSERNLSDERTSFCYFCTKTKRQKKEREKPPVTDTDSDALFVDGYAYCLLRYYSTAPRNSATCLEFLEAEFSEEKLRLSYGVRWLDENIWIFWCIIWRFICEICCWGYFAVLVFTTFYSLALQ